jgi:hypothetical protein
MLRNPNIQLKETEIHMVKSMNLLNQDQQSCDNSHLNLSPVPKLFITTKLFSADTIIIITTTARTTMMLLDIPCQKGKSNQ